MQQFTVKDSVLVQLGEAYMRCYIKLYTITTHIDGTNLLGEFQAHSHCHLDSWKKM